MTIDEAVAHTKEIAERNRKQYKNCPTDRRDIEHQTCEECAEEHEQLAKWLEDYKRLRSISERPYENCHNITCRRKCENEGYIKAINEFANELKSVLPMMVYKDCSEIDYEVDYALYNLRFKIDKIAEQLKENN